MHNCYLIHFAAKVVRMSLVSYVFGHMMRVLALCLLPSVSLFVSLIGFCLCGPLEVLQTFFSNLLNKERQTFHLCQSLWGTHTVFAHNRPTRGLLCVCPNGNLDTSSVRAEQVYHTDKNTHFHATEELIKHNAPGWEQDWDVCLCVWLNHAACSVGERRAGQLTALTQRTEEDQVKRRDSVKVEWWWERQKTDMHTHTHTYIDICIWTDIMHIWSDEQYTFATALQVSMGVKHRATS